MRKFILSLWLMTVVGCASAGGGWQRHYRTLWVGSDRVDGIDVESIECDVVRIFFPIGDKEPGDVSDHVDDLIGKLLDVGFNDSEGPVETPYFGIWYIDMFRDPVLISEVSGSKFREFSVMLGKAMGRNMPFVVVRDGNTAYQMFGPSSCADEMRRVLGQ